MKRIALAFSVCTALISGGWFDTLYDLYTGVSDRFELWCGIIFSMAITNKKQKS